ncbi:kinase domain-containing protein [Dothidotthia symphoricarpi CBS 119687]|uniref:Autophagy-related protein 1 n=1 Tax=Dothidotthia symphoricarpi CBS 119687 TaxID=1392245 RepID=A0A6A6ARK1_9PLEO|nr:kinase domain-containing protein [Dothidotthia symphoricarpi CBS 119687]KAF2133798.1 kinase domain-containing protein [Dothidotthia symphoricarpi CBS 119687]
MNLQDPRTLRDSGAITPPVTPIKASHSRSSSNASDVLNGSSTLRHGDFIPSSTSERPRKDSAAPYHLAQKPSGTELIRFPFHLSDYEIQTDKNGRKQPIGSGAWSDVYLAKPVFSNPIDQIESTVSPPMSPMDFNIPSQEANELPFAPPLYAIKIPASRSARKVLGEEARILSYLSQLPDVDHHVVSFYGQDTRTDALVLKAMAGTLEDWVQKHLNTLPEASRAQALADVFPTLASSLLDSLRWLHSKSCTHADVKPANILLPAMDLAPRPIFSDFSSAILTAFPTEHDAAQQGAGTWDYLDPILLSTANLATASETTDLWSLAITLLFVVVGASPFDALRGNKFRLREMIKQGDPLACLAYGDEGIRNMMRVKGLSQAMGFDVLKWFGKVLCRDVGKRVDMRLWKLELDGAVEM